MFKYIAVVVMLAVVGVGAYLFWMRPMPQAERPEQAISGIKADVEAEVPRHQGNPLPPGTVFEDGTIPE